MDEWVEALTQRLGVDLPVDVSVILDLAGEAAHAVERPAAPVTTFLVGLAAGRAGGAAASVEQAVREASALAASWPSADPA